jgi:hypothetical protein
VTELSSTASSGSESSERGDGGVVARPLAVAGAASVEPVPVHDRVAVADVADEQFA